MVIHFVESRLSNAFALARTESAKLHQSSKPPGLAAPKIVPDDSLDKLVSEKLNEVGEIVSVMLKKYSEIEEIIDVASAIMQCFYRGDLQGLCRVLSGNSSEMETQIKKLLLCLALEGAKAVILEVTGGKGVDGANPLFDLTINLCEHDKRRTVAEYVSESVKKVLASADVKNAARMLRCLQLVIACATARPVDAGGIAQNANEVIRLAELTEFDNVALQNWVKDLRKLATGSAQWYNSAGKEEKQKRWSKPQNVFKISKVAMGWKQKALRNDNSKR
jgi:hypothetical protein